MNSHMLGLHLGVWNDGQKYWDGQNIVGCGKTEAKVWGGGGILRSI